MDMKGTLLFNVLAARLKMLPWMNRGERLQNSTKRESSATHWTSKIEAWVTVENESKEVWIASDWISSFNYEVHDESWNTRFVRVLMIITTLNKQPYIGRQKFPPAFEISWHWRITSPRCKAQSEPSHWSARIQEQCRLKISQFSTEVYKCYTPLESEIAD